MKRFRINYDQFDRFRAQADSAGMLSPTGILPSFSAWQNYYDSSADSSAISYSKSTSITFDDSASLNTSPQYTLASTIHTMDADKNFYWDSDATEYANQITLRSV